MSSIPLGLAVIRAIPFPVTVLEEGCDKASYLSREPACLDIVH